MTVLELSDMSQGQLKVMSGYNGKILCKNFNSKKHIDIAIREISTIWTEINTTKSGFSNIAMPILCCYVCGNIEYEKEHNIG